MQYEMSMKYRFRRSNSEVTSGEFNVPFSDVIMEIMHRNESLNNIIYYLDQRMLNVLRVMSIYFDVHVTAHR